MGYGHKMAEERGKTVGAVADGVNWIVNKGFSFGVKRQVNKKIDEMYPDIYKAIGDHTGVLVIVQYQQWREQNGAENNPLQLLYVSIGPAGSNVHYTYRAWCHKPKLIPSPGKRMVLGPTELRWFTKILSTEEKIKRALELEKQYWESAR
jgi:hypothetical protein